MWFIDLWSIFSIDAVQSAERFINKHMSQIGHPCPGLLSKMWTRVLEFFSEKWYPCLGISLQNTDPFLWNIPACLNMWLPPSPRGCSMPCNMVILMSVRRDCIMNALYTHRMVAWNVTLIISVSKMFVFVSHTGDDFNHSLEWLMNRSRSLHWTVQLQLGISLQESLHGYKKVLS